MRVSLGRTRVQAHHRARSAPVALLTRTVIRQRTARRARQARTPDAATHSATSVSLVRWTATRTLQHRVPLVRQVSTGRTARLSRPASVSSVLRGGRMPTSTVGRVALSVLQGRMRPLVQSRAMCARPGRSITTSTRAQRALHAVLAPFGQLARQTPSARARSARSVRLTRTATARQRVRAVQRRHTHRPALPCVSCAVRVASSTTIAIRRRRVRTRTFAFRHAQRASKTTTATI